ncbi:MAG: hypothetical protein LBC45_06135 [Chlamydiales bacterium]|jgi:hypothetical protein|nr:hypothetical protein [Chlamydiales bacterium]
MKKKTPFYKERDERQREEFRKKGAQIPEERRIYMDERGINEYLYRENGRAAKGEKIDGAVSGVLVEI